MPTHPSPAPNTDQCNADADPGGSARPLRVLFVNAVGALGGAERCLLTAMRAARSAGHHVRLLACSDGPLLAEAAALGVHAAVVPMPRSMVVAGESGGILNGILRAAIAAPAAFRYVRRLRRAVADATPDLIHSNNLKTHLFLAWACPPAPVVWHLHDFVGTRKLMGTLLERASPRAARAIAISQAVRRDASAVLQHLPIDVVLNAIDVERFSPAAADGDLLDRLADPAPVPVQVPAAPGVVRVGLIATYARWKGHGVFLRAAARAVADRPELNLRFYVIGGPIYQTSGSQWSRDELAALAASLGLGHRVAFVPFQADPLPVYRALDVVVHASTKPEPFGLTIVEAMACGRATVVSRAGGAAEIFADGVDALGVTPGDVADLARRIATLAADPPGRRRIGAAARQTAVARFSDARLGQELSAVYHRALAPRRDHPAQ